MSQLSVGLQQRLACALSRAPRQRLLLTRGCFVRLCADSNALDAVALGWLGPIADWIKGWFTYLDFVNSIGLSWSVPGSALRRPRFAHPTCCALRCSA